MSKLSLTDKVTTNMDLELKAAFMASQSLHKKDFRAAVERGALAIIADIDPEKALELEISILQKQLLEKEQALADYRITKNAMKQLKNINTKAVDPGIEKIRLEKFETRKSNLAFQVNKGNIDWKPVMNIFMFDTQAEAREWIISKLQECDLLE